MEAREYLKKVSQICKVHEKRNCGFFGDCPLYQYACGIPVETEDIEKVVEVVENYEMPWLCEACGYNLELKELQGRVVSYCPICGSKVEKAPDSVASTEQEQQSK